MLTTQICHHDSIARSYCRYRDLLRSYVRLRMPEGYEAEDLVQGIFLRLLERHYIIDEANALSLLLTIAHNLLTDLYRKKSRRNEILKYWSALYDSDRTASTEDKIICREVEKYYDLQIENLPQRRRVIYEMMEFYGLTAAEVASRLSVSPRTVENSIYNARKSIRRAMTEYLEAA